jgi:hypothetical protein
LDSPESLSSWALILEGRELLRIYRDLQVAKVDRANNSVAHVLAQFSKAGFSGYLSFDAPDCVRELVSSEMM